MKLKEIKGLLLMAGLWASWAHHAAAEPAMRLELDWIALPHAEANRLLRTTPAGPEFGSGVLREARRLVAAGQGRRVQQQALWLDSSSGNKGEVSNVREFGYPASVIVPELSWQMVVEGGNVVDGWVLPARLARFERQPLGFHVTAELYLGEDLNVVDGSLAVEWDELVGEQTWGTGLSEVRMPVFHHCDSYTQQLFIPGKWKVVALFRPGVEGEWEAGGPVSEERVLVMAKVVLDRPGPDVSQVEESGVEDLEVLTEWIEVETAEAWALQDRYPLQKDGGKLRQVLQERIAAGQGALVETAFATFRSGQKTVTKSVMKCLVPRDYYPGMGPMREVHLPDPEVPVPVTRPVFWPLPACPQTFESWEIGTVTQLGGWVVDGGELAQLQNAQKFGRITGLPAFGRGANEVRQMLLSLADTSGSSVQGSVVELGMPVLLGCQDALPAGSLEKVEGRVPDVTATGRKYLIFQTVNAWPPG